jgi:RimJ/RimL family protein N-acetyltransferase
VSHQRSPIPLPEPILSDGVVSLRPWTKADIPAIVAICGDELSARFTTVPAPYTAADAREWLTTHPARLAAGDGASFAVVEPPADVPVATIGLHMLDTGMAELGYLTAPAARGRGVMTRSVKLIAEWAFTALEIERLQLTTHVDNPASQRVAEKCGFEREGVLRGYRVQRGERVDLVMFARLPGDQL